ncbi:MAG: hypothetical protein ABEH38_04440 [Flavobacteriales bacterium]
MKIAPPFRCFSASLLLGLSFFLFSLNSHSQNFSGEDRSYLTSFDLDGDSIPDRVSFSYSGGSHCCYQPHIFLSSDSTERSYPFRMEGGYDGGVDGTHPEQFRIGDLDGDSLPEVYMRIKVYEDRQRNVPHKWSRLYGISKNRIYFDHEADSLWVRDMGD